VVVALDAFLDAEKNLQAIHKIGIAHLRHYEYAEALEVFEEEVALISPSACPNLW
jgi:hypothetical protein